MLLRQGERRDEGIDRRLGWTLAAIAGALNTAAFHAVGFFAANMTGNVSLVSNNLAFGDLLLGLFFLAILLCFIAGAAFATFLTSYGHRSELASIYALGILLEALLMAALGVGCLWVPLAFQSQLLVLGLSFLMGLQNAVVTRISQAKVRTTHVSGMSTDIGIELAMLADIRRGVGDTTRTNHFRNRLVLHCQTLAAFLIGGIIGVLLYQVIELYMLFVCAGLLLLMAGKNLWRVR